MSSDETSSRGTGSLVRRLSTVLMLGASLMVGTTGPAWAQGRHGGGGGGYAHGGGGAYQGHGGGGAYHGGAQPAAPMARPMPAPHPQMAPQARPVAPAPVRAAPVRTAPAPVRSYGAQPRAGRPVYANPGNRNVRVDNRRGGNTYVRVDRSRDVYVHRNTVVRPAPRPYARAPYAYGGHRYYAYHPYVYHRYTPYYWGPAFQPFGFFVGALAATAIVVTVADTAYRYDQGVWYAPGSGGYAVVTAPVGAFVTALPPGAVAVAPNEYYYGGAYYAPTGGGYTVVSPQAGTVVDQLPPGGEEVVIGDQRYVKFGDTYYLPFLDNGQPRYEVVQVQ